MSTIIRRRALLPALAGAAVAVALLAGCTAQSTAPSVGHVPAAPLDGGEMMAGDQAAGEASGQVQTDASAAAERAVITTGWMQVTVDDPVAGAAEATELAESAGGRVDSRSETPGTDTQPARASLTLRIPADEFEAVLDQLRELGRVDQVQTSASDVTTQQQDLDARIEALTASVDRLEQLLAQATTTADLVAIESELTTRQAELDSLTQQRDWLADQVDYSTLSLELVTEGVAPSAGPDDFWSGLVAGWESLVAFGSAALVALGVALPWLALLVLVAAIIVGVVLAATAPGRRRAEAAEAQPQPPAQERAPDQEQAPVTYDDGTGTGTGTGPGTR
ncbi:DUF4349 domain-containing protein [Agromyces soli]